MTKHIVDSELLDQAVAAIEKEMCVQCDGISCCKPESLTALGRIQDVLRTKPAADSGMEVVAWQDAENPLYTTGEKRQMHGWATDGYPIVELVRKSDADARDAMRLERIAELEADNARLVEDRARFPDRPDFIGNMIAAHFGNLRAGKEQADKYAEVYRCRMDRAEEELAALKAQEPVAWMVSGGESRPKTYEQYPEWAVGDAVLVISPLYATPVAKQEVVMPEPDIKTGRGYPAYSVEAVENLVARLNGGKPNE